MTIGVLDNVIIKLLSTGDAGRNYRGKRFYGHFINNMNKVFIDEFPAPHQESPAGVRITDRIELHISEKRFSALSEMEQIETLEHECKHIMNNHMGRLNHGDKKHMLMWNAACDLEINEPLPSLHENYCCVDKFRSRIPDLKKGETAEYYFAKLREYQEKNPNDKEFQEMMEPGDNHEMWQDGDGEANDEITREVIKRELKKAVESCRSGDIPNEVRVALERLNKSTINWKQQLRRFLARTNKFHKENTRRKPNRRYGYYQCGRKKVPDAHIAIGLDNSGSVGNDEFKQFFAEIEEVIDYMKITIIEADCKVNAVYEYKKGMKIERHGYGGTAYMPAINKAKELKVDGMIYFGDGDIFGEQLTKPKFPFLWALVRNSPAPAEWGGVVRVKVDE